MNYVAGVTHWFKPYELPTEAEIDKMFPVNFSEPKDSPYNLMQLAKRNGAKAITNPLKSDR
jgi:hypothetical protein